MSVQFQKPNRPISKVYLHCSASDRPEHDNVETMEAWHYARWGRPGRKAVGYHFFISKNGTIYPARSLERRPCSAKGHNTGTIAICCHGLTVSKFTDVQMQSLVELCQEIDAAYDGKLTFHGHKEVSSKACPVYDYRKTLGLNSKGYMAETPVAISATEEVPYDTEEKEEPRTQQHRVIKIMSRGEDVRLLQQVLGIDADGIFGRITWEAVLDFQEDNGLEEDGIVGPDTWRYVMLKRKG